MFLYCSIPHRAELGNTEMRNDRQGERIAGGFILISGMDGTRYAVRQQAITIYPRCGRVPGRNRSSTPRWARCARPVLVGRSAGLVRVEMVREPAVVPCYAARVSDLGP